MKIEIVLPDGDLKREVWDFSLSVGYSSPCIFFDAYCFQTKLSTRHRNWISQTHWQRLEHRNNNIENPPLPKEVEEEMRSRYQECIKEIPIVK